MTPPGASHSGSGSAAEDSRTLARGAGANLAGSVLRAIRPVFFIVVARLFGEVPFGIFMLSLTVIDLSAFLALFGFEDALLKYVAEYRTRSREKLYQVLRSAAMLSIGFGCLLALMLIAGGDVLGGWFRKPELGRPLALMAAGLPFYVGAKTLLAACRGAKVMVYSVLALDVGESALLLVGTLALYGLFGTTEALYWAYPVAEVGTFGLAVFFYRRLFSLRQTWSARGLPREFLAFSLPVGGSNLLGQVMQKVDVFLVGYFLPLAHVGIYRAANDMAYLLVKVRAAFTPIVSPMISEFHATGNSVRLAQSMIWVARWSAVLAFPIVFAYSLVGSDFLRLYGPSFETGYAALLILAGAFFVNLSLGPTPQLTAIGGRPYRMLAYTAAIVGLEAALGVLLIPRFGIMGAALGAGIPMILSKVPFLFDAWSILGRPPYDRRWSAFMVAAAGTFGVVLLARQTFPFHPYRWAYYAAGTVGLGIYFISVLRPVLREMRGHE